MTDTNREQARAYYLRRLSAPAPLFSNVDESHLRAFAAHCLRWIDCAPKGARFQLAPLRDKRGEPLGTCFREDVGPCKALRDAREARGLNPLTGVPAPVVRDPESWQAVADAGRRAK